MHNRKLRTEHDFGLQPSGVASQRIWGGPKILGEPKCLILGE